MLERETIKTFTKLYEHFPWKFTMFFPTKISTWSPSARFLNSGDHRNPVPDLAARPPGHRKEKDCGLYVAEKIVFGLGGANRQWNEKCTLIPIGC